MNGMREYLLFVVGVALWDAAGLSSRLAATAIAVRLRRWFASIGPRRRDVMVLVTIALLIAAVAARQLVVSLDDRHLAALPAWYRALPFPIVLSLDAWSVPAPRLPSLLSEGLAILVALALTALYVLLVNRRTGRVAAFAIVGGSIAMVALALHGHVLASADLYAYAGYARLGAAAYVPPATAFTGSFAAVNHLWFVPMTPSVYGPLWLWYAHALAGGIGDLATVIRVLQLANVAILLALAALLPALGFGWPIVALLVLNPFIMDQFVHEGHNDLLAVTLVVAAFAAVRRSPPLAALAVCAAGLVKLPFIAIGAVVFGALPRPLALVYTAAAIGLGLAASYAFGGMAYVHALAGVGSQQSSSLDFWARPVHIALAMVALGAIALRVWAGKRAFFAGWCVPALSTTTYPWYQLWSLAYAMDDPRSVAATLILLPLIGVATDSVFSVYKIATFETIVIALLAVVVVATRLRFNSSVNSHAGVAPAGSADATRREGPRSVTLD